MNEESVLKIPARLEGLDLILSFVSFLLDSHGCSPQARTQLRMAVEEDGMVTLRLFDGGTPFNPLEKDDPDIMLSGEERGIGGLGIFMVKTMVDEVEYEYRDGCNQLTLRKQL